MISRFLPTGKRNFNSLNEQEILALAISSEEDDARIYASYAEGLREVFPDSAKLFDEMVIEENQHRQWLIELHQEKFGEVIPLIRRDHVSGFYNRKPDWLVKPFAEYAPEDIRPLYDSLRLTDFNIKKVKIRAYSSVEGTLKRNIELQEQRAESIVKALQSFQKPVIINDIESSENWVEFLNDISGTKYENLKTLSKKQVRKKIVGKLSDALELYLKNHRKAVVTLELDKKDKYKEMTYPMEGYEAESYELENYKFE